VKIRGKASEPVRDANGGWNDGKTMFIDIVCFDKVAQHAYDSLKKGDTITVSGKLEANEYEDEQGNKKTFWKIVADSVGVSLKRGPVGGNVATVVEKLGATEMTEVPF
jgi:single-strand DNA-binding protein